MKVVVGFGVNFHCLISAGNKSRVNCRARVGRGERGENRRNTNKGHQTVASRQVRLHSDIVLMIQFNSIQSKHRQRGKK